MISIALTEERRSKLPRFFIVGAAKSGTTTLHSLLEQHPDLYLPRRETHFFSIDDPEHCPYFSLSPDYGNPNWNYERRFEEYLAWYERFFADAQPNQLRGEDCTSYMPSEKVPARIKELIPEAKIIFLLRDPVARAYSQYWHLVRDGRAIHGFEETLRFGPVIVLQRGFYRRQIERYLAVLPRERIKFVLFEEFIRDMQKTADEVCEFLGVPQSLRVGEIKIRQNKARVPRSPSLQLNLNRMLRGRAFGYKFLKYQIPGIQNESAHRLAIWLFRRLSSLNSSRNGEYPPMRSETKAYLERLYAAENHGLSDLIGLKVENVWNYMR